MAAAVALCPLYAAFPQPERDRLSPETLATTPEKDRPMSDFVFTSESVSMGHPDKVSDQVSDGVLDALLAQDPMSRVACETLCTTDLLVLAGEITSNAQADYEQVARDVVRSIGYTSDDIGFNADTCTVDVKLHSQSGDIAMGVDREGAGDQGLMFGLSLIHI